MPDSFTLSGNSHHVHEDPDHWHRISVGDGEAHLEFSDGSEGKSLSAPESLVVGKAVTISGHASVAIEHLDAEPKPKPKKAKKKKESK